jgi:hypothetical protein
MKRGQVQGDGVIAVQLHRHWPLDFVGGCLHAQCRRTFRATPAPQPRAARRSFDGSVQSVCPMPWPLSWFVNKLRGSQFQVRIRHRAERGAGDVSCVFRQNAVSARCGLLPRLLAFLQNFSNSARVKSSTNLAKSFNANRPYATRNGQSPTLRFMRQTSNVLP